MPQQKIPRTQRAYTLRLRGADPRNTSWRKALWQTHEAVNNGTREFGDWLLTLRGGLDYTLVDDKVKGRRGRPDRAPNVDERRARRILLSLSWLSVESEIGSPARYIVASGKESSEERNRKVLAALEEILKSRNVQMPKSSSGRMIARLPFPQPSAMTPSGSTEARRLMMRSSW